MAATSNEIQIIAKFLLEGEEKLKKLRDEIDGVGESSEEAGDGLDDIRQQFADLQSETDELKVKLAELNQTPAIPFMEGLGNAATVTASGLLLIGVAIAGIGQAFDEVVKLAEDRPDLFTEQELQDVQEYKEAVQELKDSWIQAKATALTPIMRELADHVLQVRDATLVYDQYGHVIGDRLDSATRSYMGMAEAAEQSAETQVESFDGVLGMMTRLAGASDETTAKIIYNNLLQKVSVDGITEAEFELMEAVGISLGVFDEKAANSARMADDLTQAVLDGKISVEDLGKAVLALPDSKSIDVVLNMITRMTESASGISTLGSGSGIAGRRASGGPVFGANAYAVVENNMPELLTMGGENYLIMPPGKNGFVTPATRGVGSASEGGMVMVNVNISSPITIIDQQHAQDVIEPFVYEGIRRAQAEGLV